MRVAFTKPPLSLRRAKLDNLTLVPASLLPFKEEYQRIANQQPPGTTLIVLPAHSARQQQALGTVAARLRARGHRVLTVGSDKLIDLAGRQEGPLLELPPEAG